MEYYFINTDSNAREDLLTCDLWFKYGMAFTGNLNDKCKKKHDHGEILAKFRPNDILLMYHNKRGVVGIGEVLENWDSKTYTDSERLLYRKEKYEHRITVNWFIDWQENPKKPKNDLELFNPRGTYAKIDKDKYKIEKLVSSKIENRIEENAIDEELEVIYEGNKKEISTNVFKRNPRSRQGCIARWGNKCFICGFDFKEFYGENGEGYIHVHHLKPLSSYEKEGKINPVTDLRPLCANCHVIVHRRNPPYSMEEIKRIIKYTFPEMINLLKK